MACSRTLHPVSLDLPANVQIAQVQRAQTITLQDWLWIPVVEEETPADVLERCWAGEDVMGLLLLVLDERLPWETVRDVLYSANQAGFEDFAYLVEAPPPLPLTETTSSTQVPLTPAEGTPWGTLASQMAESNYRVSLVHEPGLEPVGIPIPHTEAVEARSLEASATIDVLRTGPLRGAATEVP